jgi:hypothetical protein
VRECPATELGRSGLTRPGRSGTDPALASNQRVGHDIDQIAPLIPGTVTVTLAWGPDE